MVTSTRVQGRTFTSRLAQVRRWVANRVGDTRHEHRVMRIAVRLFDLLSDEHGLGHEHRRTLKLAAMLHDVGRMYGSRRHHIRGAKMILSAGPSLPLRQSERRIVAYLARHHRGAIPSQDEATLLADGDDPRAAHVLLAILRAADTLDNRKMLPPGLAIRLRGRRLRIRCHVRGQMRRARRVFRNRCKFEMLRRELGVRVRVRLRHCEESDLK